MYKELYIGFCGKIPLTCVYSTVWEPRHAWIQQISKQKISNQKIYLENEEFYIGCLSKFEKNGFLKALQHLLECQKCRKINQTNKKTIYHIKELVER